MTEVKEQEQVSELKSRLAGLQASLDRALEDLGDEMKSRLAGLQASLDRALEDLGDEMDEREIAEAQLEAARITMVEAVELTLREGPNVGMMHIRQWVDDHSVRFDATVTPHDWLSQWDPARRTA